MATHQLAKGLASLGRHGDSMLMHVSPSEVAGLKAIGAATGRHITTNPHTGMPEAFSFGDFFSSLIPTGIGFLLGGPAGAAMGFEKGSMMAPVIGGMAAGAAVAGAKGEDPLMGGLMGGLGGYGGGNLAGSVGKMGANALNAPLNTEMAKRAAEQTAGGYAPTLGGTGNVGMASTFQNQLGGTGALANVLPNQVSPQSFEALKAGAGQFAADPFGKGYEAFKQAGGTGMQLGMPLAMAGLAGAQEDLYPEFDTSLEDKRKAEENKYKDPITGRLNLAQASPGLRLATGGSIGTNTSTISSGGIQDLYGTNDQTTGTQNLSRDGYGIGRLDSLASEGSRAKAADTFYAAGGPIAFAEGGSSNIYIPGYNNPTSINGNVLANGNPLLALLAQLFAKQGLLNAKANTPTPAADRTPSAPTTINPMNEPGMFPQASKDYMATRPTDKGTFALEAAKGGYLDGHGDGMSDSIPATIEGKQPARLADGEFVVPADVVSHLGNGSSKAGSKRLYDMMHKVRKARTGNPKQGKEINPNKYMPA